jgi:cysteine desulfurase/selenocysteine lyase
MADGARCEKGGGMTIIGDIQERAALDVESIRNDFPILSQMVYGKKLVYIDNAASAQKPRAVIDAISRTYETEYANVHRGVHYLSQRATDAMEGAREKIRAFINAADTCEIIFVRGATEGINLVASSWGGKNLREGDEIIISEMEHHSNIVPWQMVCERTGAILKVVPVDDDGGIVMDAYEALFTERTRIVAITHISNALGTITPIKKIIDIAHEHDVPVLVDGCQAAPHMAVDVQALDADFYVFSGHKIYGPSGIGVLYGKKALLDAMPPYQGGGEMIDTVTFEKSTWADLPFKFEAGTPHIAGAIAMGAAVDYITGLGFDAIARHEDALLKYATERLGAINNLRIIGTTPEKAAIVSFVLDDVHPHDIGTILDRQGIAVRTGHHCAQPVMERFDVAATVRASFAFYNTTEEIDTLVKGLAQVREIFG